MSLEKISNFVQRAQDRLIEQDNKRVNMPKLTACFVSEVQAVENAMFHVYKDCGIYSAIGAQLDIIGRRAGEERLGRSDEVYRTAILARIKINVSAGEPNNIIEAIQQIMNTDIIDFTELYPAYFTIFIQSMVNIPNIATIIREMSPAGVGSTISVLPSNYTPFIFTTTKGTPGTFEIQSNGLAELEIVYAPADNYSLEVVAQEVVNTDSIYGWGTAYPVEALLTIDDIGTEYDIGDGTILNLKTINANEDYTISDFGGRWATVKI